MAVATKAKVEAEPSLSERIASLVSVLKARVAQFAVRFATSEGVIKLIARFLSAKVSATFLGLLESYICAVAKHVGDRKRAAAITIKTFQKMMMAYAIQMEEKYEFPSYHRSIRAPFNYYDLGMMYVGNLLNFSRSLVRNPDRWDEIDQRLKDGENVVLFANHQSEADAAFIPLMTEFSHPGLGERVIYVAGDRVVEDTLAKPFSMGRNLLCVYSKKHMADFPETRSAKMRKNIATIKEIERLMKEGGHLIWVAPAGGRDRPNAETGVLLPDKWDPDAVELFRKLSSKKGTKPTHFFPLAMATHDIMPPPKATEKSLGEDRTVAYSGVGLSLAAELDVSDNSPAYEGVDMDDAVARKGALAAYGYEKVVEEYKKIDGCMHGDDTEPLDTTDAFIPRRPDYIES